MFTDLGKVLGNGKTKVNKILTELSPVRVAIKQWYTIQWGKGSDREIGGTGLGIKEGFLEEEISVLRTDL